MTIKKENLVSVIIVTRNRQEEVSACIKSVFLSNYPYFEIILVDNGSEDKTVPKIKKKFPKAKIITANKNLGAMGGKNLGQKYAKGDYFLFLDSDTVVDKNLLTELVKVAQSDSQIGMVCPKMYYFDKKNVIWYAGASINFLTSQAKNLGNDEIEHGQHDQVRETSFAPTAYLVKRVIAEKLKEHGQLYFMGYVDSDYGYRTKEAGYKVMFCPKAKLWHRIGQYENSRTIRALGYNLPLRAYYFARNRVVFMKNHAPFLNFLIFMVTFFPLMNAYFLYKIIIFGGWRYLRPHLEGCFDGLRYAFGGKVKNTWV